VKSSKYYILTIVLFLLVIAGVFYVSSAKKDIYLQRGKTSYEKHCANCHGKNGEGLQLLIPPLTDPKWVNNDSIVCIIRNGLEGNITVNGNPYNSRMTSNYTIENDEMADLISYIRHEFTKKPQRIKLKEVSEQILKCK